MTPLKRLEAMKRWQREGGSNLLDDLPHAGWGLEAGLLRVDLSPERSHALVPTDALAPAITKAEAEHARHRTEEMRDVHRRRDGDSNRAKQAAEPGLWRWRTW